MVRDATAAANMSRMTAGERRMRGSSDAAANVLLIIVFLVASVDIDTAGALPTWRRLGFRRATGVRLLSSAIQLLNL